MSNAIAQSATQLAVSSNGEDDFDFNAAILRAAVRQGKGITQERAMLNYQKLRASVITDFKSHFPEIYTKVDRIPSSTEDKINALCEKYINSRLSEVNMTNSVNYRRYSYHNFRGQEVTERIAVVGENKLTLADQRMRLITFITAAERRLKDLEAKPTTDHDRERAVKESIMKYNLTKTFIEGEISRQNKLIAEASKAKQ